MKIVGFQIVTLIFSVFFLNAGTIYWSELDIVNQIKIISGLFFMLFLAVVAIIIFRSVWIRNGYAGLDNILVDKEVALFMSHVLAFALLEIFFFMILFYEYTKPPEYAFWICAAGFLSPEVVQVVHFLMEQYKNKIVKKNDN